MRFWKDLSIRKKLVILFLMAAIFPSLILGTIIAEKSSNALKQRIYSELATERDTKKIEILSYFSDLKDSLESIGQTHSFQYLYAKYHRAFALAKGTKNGVYKAMTLSLQKGLEAIVKSNHLNNLLLVDPKGHIIASYTDNGMLGKNFFASSFKNTSLATEISTAIKTKKTIITDLPSYPPITPTPQIFFIVPIINGDEMTLLFDPHTFMGLLIARVASSKINSVLEKGLHLGKTGTIYIVNPDHIPYAQVGNPLSVRKKKNATNKTETLPVQAALAGKTGVMEAKNASGRRALCAYTPLSITARPWALVTEISHAEAFAPIFQIRKITFLTGGILYLFAIILALIAAKGITRPIKMILENLKAIANGDFSKEINIKSRDEIGQMGTTLQSILDNIIGEGQSFKEGLSFPFFLTDKDLKITYANTHFATLVGKEDPESIIGQSCGSLVKIRQCNTDQCLIKRALETGKPTRDISDTQKNGETYWFDVSASVLKDLKGNVSGAYEILMDITQREKSKNAIEKNREILLQMIEEVQTAARQVSIAAELLSSQSEDIATGAEEQANQASQVAAAMEEMIATISEVAKSAQEAADRSKETRDVATKGHQIVETSVQKIQELTKTTQRVAESIETLAEKSREINKVIDVISEIADQTNLLALNATIEAASAGEAGKGFAVVAGEVKELAKQTAASTESVNDAIQLIQEGIRQSVEMIEETLKEVQETAGMSLEAGNSLKEILTKADITAEMVSRIAAAAQQQSAAIGEISKNVDSIMNISTQTTQAIMESTQATKELAQLSDNLMMVIERFQE